MKIAQIRDIIRRAMWTRNDLTGGTREEFRKQAVGTILTEKVAELKMLVIPARFVQDISDRDGEIERCNTVIERWNGVRNMGAA